MIIFGWGRRTTKDYGAIGFERCGNCNNDMQRQLLKITTWFTLFFIPIIPYQTQYLMVCPICQNAYAISKQEFLEMLEGHAGGRSQNSMESGYAGKYAGKNEIQINYLKTMEELEARKSTDLH